MRVQTRQMAVVTVDGSRTGSWKQRPGLRHSGTEGCACTSATMRAGTRDCARRARLRIAARSVRLLAATCIRGWCPFWLTTIDRIKPNPEAPLVLAELAPGTLDRLVPDSAGHSRFSGTLSRRRVKIARLVGSILLKTASRTGRYSHVERSRSTVRHRPRHPLGYLRCGQLKVGCLVVGAAPGRAERAQDHAFFLCPFQIRRKSTCSVRFSCEEHRTLVLGSANEIDPSHPSGRNR